MFEKKLNYSKGWMIPLLYFSNLFQVFYCIFFKIAHLFFNYIIKINNVLNCLQNINIQILFLKGSIKEILLYSANLPKPATNEIKSIINYFTFGWKGSVISQCATTNHKSSANIKKFFYAYLSIICVGFLQGFKYQSFYLCHLLVLNEII